MVSVPVVKDVIDYEDLSGRTESIKSVDVRARVSGYLKEVCFAGKEGSDVEKDQELFQIDPSIYQAEVNRSRAILKQAEAHRDRLKKELDRAAALLPTHAISQEEYDKAKGDLDEGEATIGMAQAALDLALLNLNYTRVTAEISGRISRQLIDPGNLVKADDTVLTTIVAQDPIYAYFDLDTRTTMRLRRLLRAGKIKSSREAKMPVLLGLVDEVDEEGVPQYPHTGFVNFVDNRVDAMAGTLRLRGEFGNHDRMLSPGMFVRIRIPIGKKHPAILISERALGTDQGQSFVYVVNDENQVEYRRVKLGALHDGLRVVEDGLAKEERIVVDGLQKVRPKMEVNGELVKMRPANESATPPLVTGQGPASGSRPSS
jgi:RND family efflux transporter MFP subunit